MQLSRITSAAIPQIPEYVSGLKDRLSEAEKTQQRLTSELAKREGEAAYSTTTPSVDGMRRWFQEVPSIDEAVRARAQAFAAMPKAVVLAAASDPASALIACSADSGMNAGVLLKEVLAAAGARGGGSAMLAQGRLPTPGVLRELRNKLGFEALANDKAVPVESQTTQEQ